MQDGFEQGLDHDYTRQCQVEQALCHLRPPYRLYLHQA